MPSRKQTVAAALAIAATTLAAPIIGGLATASSVSTWYREELTLPPWNPPSWVFGPVWTTLYVLMALAALLVWRRLAERTGRSLDRSMRLPFGLYALQVALNALWPVLFFGLRSPGTALVQIVPLIVAIAATFWAFWRVRPVAAWLLTPYLGWTLFAGVLNATIWWMNR